MRFLAFARVGLIAALLATPAFADGPAVDTPDVAAPPIARPAAPQQAPVRAAPIAEPAATAPPVGQTGAISLPQETGLALNVPAGYRFYSSSEAQAFLDRNQATAPPGAILGLLAPAGTRIDQPDAWATVVSFQPIGYVASDSAGALSAPTFEADVRAARTGQSRTFEGFALAPAFAASGPSLTWAERSAPPASGGRDLRHEVRLLGRNGVAGLTSVGSADQMGAVQAATPDLLTMVAFGAGQRYADFNATSDRRSDYDLPGLVTGNPIAAATASTETGVAETASSDAPQGFFSGAGLQGMFPWIALGVALLAGIGFLVMRNFGRRDERYDDDIAEDDDDEADDPNVRPQA